MSINGIGVPSNLQHLKTNALKPTQNATAPQTANHIPSIGQTQSSQATTSNHQVNGGDLMKAMAKDFLSGAFKKEKKAPATTETADSTLMTYSRRDMKKFMASAADGPDSSQVNPTNKINPSQGVQKPQINPFTNARI